MTTKIPVTNRPFDISVLPLFYTDSHYGHEHGCNMHPENGNPPCENKATHYVTWTYVHRGVTKSARRFRCGRHTKRFMDKHASSPNHV